MNISPSEPVWLTLDDILDSHAEQIALFGGSDGIRDQGLIESALARPRHLYDYEGERDTLTLAVRLGLGLAKNHPFIDGNKHAGAVAMIEFLMLNGYELNMPNDTAFGVLFEAAVAGRITEEELARELYSHVAQTG